MNLLQQLFSWIFANWANLLASIIILLNAIIGVALIIPGPQPEAFLQKIVDFLSRISNKPKQ